MRQRCAGNATTSRRQPRYPGSLRPLPQAALNINGSPTPEEAAAIAAAIELFVVDTAPPLQVPKVTVSPWFRAGLLQATGNDPEMAPTAFRTS